MFAFLLRPARPFPRRRAKVSILGPAVKSARFRLIVTVRRGQMGALAGDNVRR
jgi:hypothetical protein